MAKEVKAAQAAAPKKKTDEKQVDFIFGKENYKLIILGLGILLLGFLLMIGGGSKDPKVFNPAIFDFQRITLALILILGGFVVEIFAIFKKSKD